MGEAPVVNITYLIGDATQPQGTGPAIIAHLCNDVGSWGQGFLMSLSRRWKAPEKAYRAWFAHAPSESETAALGSLQLVSVGANLWVANMIAQHGVRATNGVAPIRYGALETCLHKLVRLSLAQKASVHMPRIGLGRAGGSWDKVEPMIQKMLIGAGVPVFVYELAEKPAKSRVGVGEP